MHLVHLGQSAIVRVCGFPVGPAAGGHLGCWVFRPGCVCTHLNYSVGAFLHITMPFQNQTGS